MIPTSGYRVIKNATTGEVLVKQPCSWEVVIDRPNNVKLVVDHGPITIKFKKSGSASAFLETENGRVMVEQDLGFFEKKTTLVFSPC